MIECKIIEFKDNKINYDLEIKGTEKELLYETYLILNHLAIKLEVDTEKLLEWFAVSLENDKKNGGFNAKEIGKMCEESKSPEQEKR